MFLKDKLTQSHRPFLDLAGLLFLGMLLWSGMVSGVERGLKLEVHVEGVSDELKQNILGMLSIERKRTSPDLTKEQLKRLHELAEAEIRTALQPFGFYSPVIQTRLTGPVKQNSPWLASYQIDAGEVVRVVVADIQVTGADREQNQWSEVIAALPIVVGQPLIHRDYEISKQQLHDFARQHGYYDANFSTSRIEVDTSTRQARIYLHMDTGPIYRFAEPIVEQPLFDADFLRRYFTFEPGDPLSTEDISALRRALSASGYFTRVGLKLRHDLVDDDHQVPLEVLLEPAKPNKYRARIGFGTNSGVGVRFDWNRRYLTGYGHSFNLGTVAVQEKNKLIVDFKYKIPLNPRDRTHLELLMRHESKDLAFDEVGLEEGGETRIGSELVELSLQHPRKLGDFLLDEKIAIGYMADSYDIFALLFGDQPQEVQNFISELLGEVDMATLNPAYSLFIPSISWTYKNSNDPIFPTRGEYARLTLSGAVDGLAANASFVQAELKASLIRQFFDKDRLIVRAEVAYTQAKSKRVEALDIALNQMPETYEFRTGGDSSVRGYAYESLISDDALTGGKHLLVGSIEYEKKILDDWSMALFYDIGNAFNSTSNMGLKAGAGVGARWYSPVGLVRLDLAFALDDENTPWRIHFRVGPEF